MRKHKENDFLRQKFQKFRYSSVAEFCRAVKSELSEETWSSILHRNTPASLKTLLVMASELDCTNQEVINLLKDRKENAISRLITNNDLGGTDKNLVGKMHLLAEKDPQKVTLVHKMVDSLLE